MREIPRDKNYPSSAVQCDACGGLGCAICEERGWLPAGHQEARRCARPGCGRPLPPDQLAVYCSDECALKDSGEESEAYMVWSNEHNGWWGPGYSGYVSGMQGAGHYTRDSALDICRKAMPTAMHLGRISELPVRVSDLTEFMQGEFLPESIVRGRR